MLRITGIVLACLFFMAPAEARHHRVSHGIQQHRVHHHAHRHHVKHYRKHHRIRRHRGDSEVRSTSGLVATLAAKVKELQSDCGSRMISGVRQTYIAGTNRISLHAFGKAADMSGNPACMYAHLKGWRGGYSIDYARMGHIHVSFDIEGGREMGLRFVHGGGHRHYAHHRRHQLVSFVSWSGAR